MAVFKLPRWAHPDLLEPGKKPTGPVEIDWSNSITKGLYEAWLLDSNLANGYCRDLPVTLENGPSATGYTLTPEYIEKDSTTARAIQMGTLPISTWNGFTAVLVASDLAPSATFRRYISIQEVAGDDFRLMNNNTTSPPDIRQDMDDGAFTAKTYSIPDNKVRAYAIGSNGTETFGWAGGIEVVPRFAETTNFGSATGVCELGEQVGGNVPGAGRYYAFLIWDRGLSDAELREITTDPYRIFKPTAELFFFTEDAAGGGITGSGSPQADTATASGSGIRTVTGSGTPQAATATASGTGIRTVTGSGTPQAATATASGTGERIVTGAGTPQAATATVSGVGERIITGSGTPQADTATASGVGTVGNVITGSGSPQADTATASGAGQRIVTGTGSPQATTATSSGAGARVVTGTGTHQADTATVSGVGARVIVGTGSPQAATATASGSETAVPNATFGVLSTIDPNGQGVTSIIDSTGTGVLSAMSSTYGVSSDIDGTGRGVTSIIDTIGLGVNSGI